MTHWTPMPVLPFQIKKNRNSTHFIPCPILTQKNFFFEKKNPQLQNYCLCPHSFPVKAESFPLQNFPCLIILIPPPILAEFTKNSELPATLKCKTIAYVDYKHRLITMQIEHQMSSFQDLKFFVHNNLEAEAQNRERACA